MTQYKVLKQPISYNGGVFYPERRAGNKIIEADVVEIDENTAKAYGDEYLEKVSKSEAKEEIKETKKTKSGK